MNILHIITTLNSGGAERMLSKLVKGDKQNSHIIVTLLEGKVHYNIENTEIIHLNKSNNAFNKIFVIKELINLVNNKDVDIVQTWLKCNYYGPVLKYFFPEIKIVSNFRNGYNKEKNFIITLISNFLLKQFDGNIFVSKSALQERKDAKLLFTNTIVINNGFEIANTIRINEKQDNTFVIGHIGRFHPVKNQLNIIKAFNQFAKDKNVKLLMAGRGLNQENINIQEASNPKVELLGEIKNVNKFYENIDVLVLASVSEGFPNVIGEAMSLGKYIITTNAGESYEILGELGYKLKNGDVSTISEAFEFIFSNRHLIHDEREKNHARILNEYSLEKIIKQYQEYYKSIGVQK